MTVGAFQLPIVVSVFEGKLISWDLLIAPRIFESGTIVFAPFEANGPVLIPVVKRVDVGSLNDALKVFLCKSWMVEARICTMWRVCIDSESSQCAITIQEWNIRLR